MATGQFKSNIMGYEQSFLIRRKEDGVRNSQELTEVKRRVNSSKSVRSLSPFQSYTNGTFEVSTQQPIVLEREFRDHRNSIEESRSNSSLRSPVMSSKGWNKITDYKTKITNKTSTSSSSRITLCTCLQSLPAPFDGTGQKLSLVGNNISEIDKVPSTLLTRVQTLYLSNNRIVSLDNIEQFTHLQNLSVTNNLIRYLSHLKSLALNEQLEKVSLEGNVVTGMPFYRQYMVGLCPRLLVLDGSNVTAEERSCSKSTTRQLSGAFFN
jgi:Leucine-rich repeat (LRR) protein